MRKSRLWMIEFWCMLVILIMSALLTGTVLPWVISTNKLPLPLLVFLVVGIAGLWAGIVAYTFDLTLKKYRRK